MSLRLVVLALFIGFSTEGLVAKENAQPNIVLIISDDAGWADFGFQGSKVIPTPNLDGLAKSGVVFSNAYAGSVCSPSRASIVTGLYNSRIGYESNISNSDMIVGTAPTIGLNPTQPTVYSLLQSAGYETALVGKWHLGMHRDNVQNGILFRAGNRPNRMGVDEFRGLLTGSRTYWVGGQGGDGQIRCQTLNDNKIIIDELAEQRLSGSYVTEVFGDWSVDFIRSKANRETPFFLCSSFTAPHTPMEAKPEDLLQIDAMANGLNGKRRIYAAMMLSMDREIGRILQAVRDPDGDGDESDSVESNTLFVFVNDNGGDCCDKDPNGCSNGVLKGGKGSSWEGGFRVPMIIAGAGVEGEFVGTEFNDPVHVIDIVPTVLAAAEHTRETLEFDGVNLFPFINGKKQEPPHEYVYLRRGFAQQTSLRMGKWKLYHHRKTGFKLFDLETNISESLDLDQLVDRPDIVARMKNEITRFDAQMMRPSWKIDNESTKFRFRESLRTQSKWSDPNVWSDEQLHTGSATLTSWDGFADTTLVFRPLSTGEYYSINDMKRQSGLPFMVNALRFRSREETIKGDATGFIEGEPVVLTTSLDGKLPNLQLHSMSKENYRVGFDIGIQLQLLSDLSITGDSRDEFVFSGGFKELNPSTNIFKKGRSRITLSAPSELSGTIEILSGAIVVAHPECLGNASVVVRPGGTLDCTVKLSSDVKARISGDGVIQHFEQE